MNSVKIFDLKCITRYDGVPERLNGRKLIVTKIADLPRFAQGLNKVKNKDIYPRHSISIF